MRAPTDAQTAAQRQAIDAWVARDLAARYDRILAESLPADIVALLKE